MRVFLFYFFKRSVNASTREGVVSERGKEETLYKESKRRKSRQNERETQRERVGD